MAEKMVHKPLVTLFSDDENTILERIWRNGKSVDEQTRKFSKEKHGFWAEQYDNWFCFFRPLMQIAPVPKNLLTLRLLEFNRFWLWVYASVCSGQYYTAIRELRALLEFVLKAHYLDSEYPGLSLDEKIRKEKKKSGKPLIEDLEIPSTEKQFLKSLYGDLCTYVHPSKKEMDMDHFDNRVSFVFNQHLFERSFRLSKDVSDAIFSLTMERFPELRERVEERQLVLKSLRRFGCERSATLLVSIFQ